MNVGAAVSPPRIKQTLVERILSEDAVVQMLALERQPRNQAILRLLYLGGLRISELCGLKGRARQANGDAGHVTMFGKGAKTRVVLLRRSIWTDLTALRAADPDQPLFRSRKGGGHLDAAQVHRIVKVVAARAGLSAAVSAHWLRHAHVSHALDHRAPAHLVQATVGHASLARPAASTPMPAPATAARVTCRGDPLRRPSRVRTSLTHVATLTPRLCPSGAEPTFATPAAKFQPQS